MKTVFNDTGSKLVCFVYLVGVKPSIRVENLNSPIHRCEPSQATELAIFIELAAFVPSPEPNVIFGGLSRS